VTLNRRHLLSFDWLWLLALLALAACGVGAIWSAMPGTGLDSYFGRQLLYIGIGLAAFLVVLAFDYHLYSDYVTFFYLAGIAILVLTLVAGHTVHNSKSWLQVRSFAIQPSELVKVVAIVGLAKYYSEIERDYLELSELVIGALITFAPMLLVVVQGDLGTAVTFLPIFAALSFLSGLKRKFVLAGVLAVAIASPIGWMTLKEYQRGRIQTVFNPEMDPHHLGYQTIQSEIAIGSGRFLGKGFKQGSQSQLGFLPARHTDFVFAVISEERGFVGSISIIGLFLLVSIRLVRTAREAKDRVGALIVAGVLGLFLFHIMINVGMVVGLLPIAGIPLPLVSAGGSSLVSWFAAMGLAMNVRMRRYVN
jgi:rod shape determining protein RodA